MGIWRDGKWTCSDSVKAAAERREPAGAPEGPGPSAEELKEALRYEFANHECQFVRDDKTVCECVGLDWDEVQNDPELKKLYNEAWKLFWKDCIDNDWF